MVKPRFDINRYKGNYAMRVRSERAAKIFCEFLATNGLSWDEGISYRYDNMWDEDADEICYCFNDGSIIHHNDSNAYNILEFDDFDWTGYLIHEDMKLQLDEELPTVYFGFIPETPREEYALIVGRLEAFIAYVESKPNGKSIDKKVCMHMLGLY